MSDTIRQLVCNQPVKTPDNPRYSHVVKACKDGKEQIIRFGQQGSEGVKGQPITKEERGKKKAYEARNKAVNPYPDFFSARYWGQRTKWS